MRLPFTDEHQLTTYVMVAKAALQTSASLRPGRSWTAVYDAIKSTKTCRYARLSSGQECLQLLLPCVQCVPAAPAARARFLSSVTVAKPDSAWDKATEEARLRQLLVELYTHWHVADEPPQQPARRASRVVESDDDDEDNDEVDDEDNDEVDELVAPPPKRKLRDVTNSTYYLPSTKRSLEQHGAIHVQGMVYNLKLVDVKPSNFAAVDELVAKRKADMNARVQKFMLFHARQWLGARSLDEPLTAVVLDSTDVRSSSMLVDAFATLGVTNYRIVIPNNSSDVRGIVRAVAAHPVLSTCTTVLCTGLQDLARAWTGQKWDIVIADFCASWKTVSPTLDTLFSTGVLRPGPVVLCVSAHCTRRSASTVLCTADGTPLDVMAEYAEREMIPYKLDTLLHGHGRAAHTYTVFSRDRNDHDAVGIQARTISAQTVFDLGPMCHIVRLV